LPLKSVCRHATIVIVLDWRHPEELHTWHAWIERWLQGNGARELKVTHEERRERCASILASFLSPVFLPRLLAAGKAHPLKNLPSRFQPLGLFKVHSSS